MFSWTHNAVGHAYCVCRPEELSVSQLRTFIEGTIAINSVPLYKIQTCRPQLCRIYCNSSHQTNHTVAYRVAPPLPTIFKPTDLSVIKESSSPCSGSIPVVLTQQFGQILHRNLQNFRDNFFMQQTSFVMATTGSQIQLSVSV